MGWWRVVIDDQVFEVNAKHMADAVYSATTKYEYRQDDWNFEFEGHLIGVERIEMPKGKRSPNPPNWLKPKNKE